MLRALLVSAASLLCVALVTSTMAVAQGEKKVEAGKSKDDGKAKQPDKSPEPGKEPVKPKTPLENIKLPRNAIVVVVDDLLKASALIPKQWIVPLEEWVALQERVKMLENQLKGERVLASTCKLVGSLKDDFVVFRGEYVFATGAGKALVPLGLQGGHLTKEGRLNKQAAILEFDKDEGFLARVDKEGKPHRLIVEFRVPVKKAAGAGLERSIDLGLPQSAGTTLDLTLPEGVRELRWNGNTEKPVAPGRWQIGLDRSKTLNLAWKAPLPPSTNTPLTKVEGQIRVDIDASHVHVNADLFMEDRRLRTEEWHIHLPGSTKVDSVKAPVGLTYTLDEKPGLAVLRVPVSSDRWQVTLAQRVPRPTGAAKVPIGPFVVQGAYQAKGVQQVSAAIENHGTITVKMPADSSLGQRLVFTRSALVNQTKNSETEAAFQYLMPAPPEKAKMAMPKAPLELEWRFDKNQLRTRVEHFVSIESGQQATEIDTTTRMKVTALFAAINAVDVKLPPLRPNGMQLVAAAAPGLSFPGLLPWGGIWNMQDTTWPYHGPDDFQITDDAGNDFKVQVLDATGKARITWARGAAKEVTLILKSTVHTAPQTRRVRLELPRPLGTQDRGAKLVLQTDDRLELLHGVAGAEDATPDRHRFDLVWEQSPLSVDVAWRPFQRDIVTESTIDVDVHEFSAQVTQWLRFPRDRALPAADLKNALISLKAPRGIEKVTLLPDQGEFTQDRVRELIYFRPKKAAEEFVELTLQYFVPITNRTLNVPAVWPAHGSHEDVKVRLWTKPGVSVRLTPDLLQRGLWQERSIELVRDRDELPALVLAGFGARLPLTLMLDDVGGSTLAALVAERALIQTRMVAEDGSQQVQARYYVTKVNAPSVDIELPIAWSRFRDPPAFYWGNVQLTQMKKLDAGEKIVRLQLPAAAGRPPAILKITYTIPPEALERSSVWATTLHAPVLRSDSLIEQTRWQLSMAAPLIAASLGRQTRAEIDWSLHGWLPTPEASAVDWDAWLQGREAAGPGPAVTFAFSGSSGPAELVYHLPRSWWLLGCSGLFLILTLGLYFSPLPRWAYWTCLGVMCLALAAFTVMYPAAWAAVAFGLQPGVVLLLVFVGVHQVVQERYRRQLVFMPGFTRTKAGSTITRTNSAKVLREASTVDAPPGAAEDAAKEPSTPSGS